MFRAIGWDNTYAALILAHVALNLPIGARGDVRSSSATSRSSSRRPRASTAARRRRCCGASSCRWSGPGLAATGILVFIFSWNEFAVALNLTARQTATVPVAIAKFAQEYEIKYGVMAAGAVLSVHPGAAAAAVRAAAHRQGADRRGASSERQPTMPIDPAATRRIADPIHPSTRPLSRERCCASRLPACFSNRHCRPRPVVSARPVKLVVADAAGGAPDQLARLVAGSSARARPVGRRRQSRRGERRARRGARGQVPADGYTLLMTTSAI